MNDTRIAAPLAQALAAKGYAQLTPVQEAVLADGVAGRDLLVSAQTGSGKTVAFGLAIAPEVLSGQDKLLYADTPLALVVAPTRELALQVRREFEWLYADTGANLASCVGGMDQRAERRALERGAHIVVGTPGRLRDHIERGSLDLSGLRAVILDEADEMLDMGFQEDLEFILAAAPPERRSLMFSATVPKPIEALAASYQKNALRIVAKGEARQHVDIEYRALNVAVRDREHAIFNVLRFYEAPTAIVFCKTRANVSHLLARMGNRGFQAVALSGELSQQERTHALQALRDGRARVCIATDVAARGIDLPGLELVIHADLPSNSEVLLHRSGRTGRAGSKGTSCLIVTPADFRKAQRLLQGAKVTAEWAKAPSADDVQAKDDARILEHPALMAGPGDDAALADDLLARFGAENVAAAFVRLWREGRSAPDELSDTPNDRAPAPPRERGEFGPSVWFSISVGHTGRAEARWLLPKLCDAGGIAKDGIGAIRVQQEETFVQIAEKDAAKFRDGMELDAGLTLRRLPGEPSLDRPERAPRHSEAEAPARAPKPAYAPKPPRVVEDEVATPRPTPRATPRADDAPSERPAPRHARPAPTWSDSAPRPVPRGAGEPAPGAIPEAARKPRRKDPERAEGYAPKSAGFKSHGGNKSEGFKSHGPSAAPRAEGFKSHASRPTDAPRPPRAKPADGAKPYRAKADADGAKPYRPKGDAEGKPYRPRAEGGDAPKPYRPKAEGDGAKPYRAKSDGTGAKPYRARSDSSDGVKPFKPRAPGAKPATGKPYAAKPYAAKPRAAKPATPPASAADTSKRFVPPKRPKG